MTFCLTAPWGSWEEPRSELQCQDAASVGTHVQLPPGTVISFFLNHGVHRMETAPPSLEDRVRPAFSELWLETEAAACFSGFL
jgi:hypothetical protein